MFDATTDVPETGNEERGQQGLGQGRAGQGLGQPTGIHMYVYQVTPPLNSTNNSIAQQTNNTMNTDINAIISQYRDTIDYKSYINQYVCTNNPNDITEHNQQLKQSYNTLNGAVNNAVYRNYTHCVTIGQIYSSTWNTCNIQCKSVINQLNTLCHSELIKIDMSHGDTDDTSINQDRANEELYHRYNEMYVQVDQYISERQYNDAVDVLSAYVTHHSNDAGNQQINELIHLIDEQLVVLVDLLIQQLCIAVRTSDSINDINTISIQFHKLNKFDQCITNLFIIHETQYTQLIAQYNHSVDIYSIDHILSHYVKHCTNLHSQVEMICNTNDMKLKIGVYYGQITIHCVTLFNQYILPVLTQYMTQDIDRLGQLLMKLYNYMSQLTDIGFNVLAVVNQQLIATIYDALDIQCNRLVSSIKDDKYYDDQFILQSYVYRKHTVYVSQHTYKFINTVTNLHNNYKSVIIYLHHAGTFNNNLYFMSQLHTLCSTYYLSLIQYFDTNVVDATQLQHNTLLIDLYYLTQLFTNKQFERLNKYYKSIDIAQYTNHYIQIYPTVKNDFCSTVASRWIHQLDFTAYSNPTILTLATCTISSQCSALCAVNIMELINQLNIISSDLTYDIVNTCINMFIERFIGVDTWSNHSLTLGGLQQLTCDTQYICTTYQQYTDESLNHKFQLLIDSLIELCSTETRLPITHISKQLIWCYNYSKQFVETQQNQINMDSSTTK